MKLLALFGLVTLIGCDTDATASCDDSTGTLSGQILFGTADSPGSPAAFARVQAWDESAGESQEDALLISSDEEGFYAVDLPAATSLDLHLDEGFGR